MVRQNGKVSYCEEGGMQGYIAGRIVSGQCQEARLLLCGRCECELGKIVRRTSCRHAFGSVLLSKILVLWPSFQGGVTFLR